MSDPRDIPPPDDDSVSRLRVPPHSIEAEQSVLGALLQDPCAIDLTGGLQEAAFYRREHRVLFAEIRALIAIGRPFDEVALVDRLRSAGNLADAGGAEYIAAVASCVPSARHVAQHAAIVREKATLRALIAASDEVATKAFKATSAAEVADQAASAFAAIQCRQLAKEPQRIAEIAVRRIDHYEALERGEVVPGWPTKLPSLDAMLNGGLRAGGLYVLAARPSVGKSSLSLSLAITLAAQGLPTLFLSLEMPADEVTDRAVVNAGYIDYQQLLGGKLDREGWSRAADAMEKLAGLPLFVDDQAALTIHDIKAKARSVKGLRVLVLDYLQLCAGVNPDDNRNTQIEELTRGLKAMAKAEGIAVIALSQLNRAVEKRSGARPNLSDLRDSGSIEQDADVVLFLWPVRELKGDEPRQIVGLAVDKNRQGPRGKFGLDFRGRVQHWGESTADIDPPKTSGGSNGGFE